MVTNTNISAQISANNLQQSQTMLSKSLARLSSGSKITSPADDAAGMSVAFRMDAQIQRLGAANTNVGNAISFTQTQDGYLGKVANALDRMSELSLLAQDATKTDADRKLYNGEFRDLSTYIDSVAYENFNGVSLFSGADLHVTVDSEGHTFAMSGIDLNTKAYSDATSATIDTADNASKALASIKTAIDRLGLDRANVGAAQSRLNLTADQLTVSKENLSAATSRIKDVDVAEESTEYARYNILVQSGTAMLAQANQVPQTVLRLLQ
jgi:flagellin